MLIEAVSPGARIALVCARRDAMRSGALAADKQIAAVLAESPNCHQSALAAQLLRCELLYLDNHSTKAAEHFDVEVAPLLEHADPDTAALVWDNRTILAREDSKASGGERFYHEVDVRRLLGVELLDWSEAYEAERNARIGKHHDALPALWRRLVRGYRMQNWRARFWAHADFARECIALGWPDEAAWHAVQSLQDDVVSEASRQLLISRSSDRIATAVSRAIGTSQLAQHATHTAQLLTDIADCIPDSLVSPVVDWVVPWLNNPPCSWSGVELFRNAWRLVGTLAPRLDPARAESLARTASTHAELERRSVARKDLIESWNRLLPQVLPEKLVEFIPTATSLLGRLKADTDYLDSVNLVCHLADLSGECKAAIRSGLFPPDTSISDPLLLEAAAFLGWEPRDRAKLNSNVGELASAISNQVQRLGSGEEAKKLGGYGSICKNGPDGTVIVHVAGAQHWIDAFLKYRKLLSAETITGLVESLLKMASDDQNLISNRMGLVNCLIELLPSLTPADLTQAGAAMNRIARGEFRESDVGQTYAEATNPLNPVKLNTGDPLDLRGVALLWLSHASRLDEAASEILHNEHILTFLEDPSEKLRRYGIAALRECDRVTPTEATILLANSLDDSPEVRMLALLALSDSSIAVLDHASTGIAVRSVTRAAGSQDCRERVVAAKAIAAILPLVPAGSRAEMQLYRLITDLRNDISSTVRRAAAPRPNVRQPDEKPAGSLYGAGAQEEEAAGDAGAEGPGRPPASASWSQAR